MTVRQRAPDLERLIGTPDHRATREKRTQPIDQFRRHLAQIGDGAFMNLATLAETLPQQHGRRRSAIRNHVDEHEGRESQTESRRKPHVWTQTKYRKTALREAIRHVQVILK
ncbi:hypothetical protein [Acidiphilium sp.]|uniref:hypothetical protein n=1 Tax=Acidiphilium sp. TaxID=527 RepID=UPI0038CF442F